MKRDLQAEAKSFDERIRERLRHGHIPDLRRVRPCDWFYNNPWRRPYLVEMTFGQTFRFALEHVGGRELLEVGCGSGHMSLEFARHGLYVTGLDLSRDSVEVARQIADENPYKETFGSLHYVAADFLTWQAPQQFDSVCFFGTLHHFGKPAEVLDKANNLLNPGGRIIACEPARDWLTLKDAAIIALMRWLLASHGGWYENLSLPTTQEEIEQYVKECLREYQEARDQSEPVQSVHDNVSFATEILAALRSHFDEVAFEPGSAFFSRMGGGVRAQSEDQAQRLSEFLYFFDQYAVATGLMNAGYFLWAGQTRKGS